MVVVHNLFLCTTCMFGAFRGQKRASDWISRNWSCALNHWAISQVSMLAVLWGALSPCLGRCIPSARTGLAQYTIHSLKMHKHYLSVKQISSDSRLTLQMPKEDTAYKIWHRLQTMNFRFPPSYISLKEAGATGVSHWQHEHPRKVGIQPKTRWRKQKKGMGRGKVSLGVDSSGAWATETAQEGTFMVLRSWACGWSCPFSISQTMTLLVSS